MSTAASAAGSGAEIDEAAVRRRFAAPAPPPPPPADRGMVASAADRLRLLDGPTTGAGFVGPAGTSVATVRSGVKRAADPARERDLVTLVAIFDLPAVENRTPAINGVEVCSGSRAPARA